MSLIHIANTDFEFELANDHLETIEQSWNCHPMCLQLQFLPLLYASNGEGIAVTTFPSSHFLNQLKQNPFWKRRELPEFVLMNHLSHGVYNKCLSWGFSQRVAKWANLNDLTYHIPDWNLVQLINSKQFSLEQHSNEAQLITDESDLKRLWSNLGTEKKIIKTIYGVSGKGNRLISSGLSFSSILKFCQKEWDQGRPLIVENYLKRFFDFSTQWEIGNRVEYRGATVFQTNAQGNYLGTLSGPETLIFKHFSPYLIEHKEIVTLVLEKIKKLGFFGPIGVDAFLYYDSNGGICLRAIVEINGRMTMSLAALRLQQHMFPDQVLQFSFKKSDSKSFPLLPTEILKGDKKIFFKSNLHLSFLIE